MAIVLLMNNSRVTKKERGLLKGAMRRVFSRSELRQQALAKHDIKHTDENRPRVTKWSFCGECGVIEPRYLMQVDHLLPVIALNETLEDSKLRKSSAFESSDDDNDPSLSCLLAIINTGF